LQKRPAKSSLNPGDATAAAEPQLPGVWHSMVQRWNLNRAGYWAEFRWYLLATAVAAAADAASTIRFMLLAGPEAELHPAVRVVSRILGPVLGPIAGKLCQFAGILVVTVYLRRWARHVFVAVIILYAWAGWYNVWGIAIYTPRLVRLLPPW